MSRLRPIVLLPIFLLIGVLPARALDCTWTGFNDNWTNPARWSCGVVPDGDDHAIIPNGTVTVAAPQTVGSLTVGSTLNVNATLTVTSTFTWQGGFIVGGNGAALVLAAGSTGTRTGGTLHTGAVLENHGTMTYAGTTGNGTGRFDNESSGLLVLAGTAAGDRIVNSGTIRKTTVATFTQTGPVESTGTIDVQAGTLVLHGTGGPNVIDGPVVVAAGATLQSTGAGVVMNYTAGASISGGGALVVGNNQNINADVTWSIASVTLSSGSLTTAQGDLTITGTFSWTGGFIVGGNNHRVILASTSTGTRTGGILHTNAIVDNRGTMTFSGALGSGSGRFDNESSAVLVLAGTAAGDRIVNSGTIRKTTAATFTQTGPVESTGTIEVQTGTLVLHGTGGPNVIAGPVVVAAGATLQSTGAGVVTNYTAGASISGGGALVVGNNQNIQADTTWSVASVTVSSGSLTTAQGDLTITGAFAWTGGFLVGGNTHRVILASTSTGTRTGGILHTDAILENRGTMTYLGALGSGSGRLDNVSPGLLVLAGTGTGDRIVNSGTVRKTTASTFSHGHTLTTTGTLHVQEGTLVLSGGANSVGGSLNVSAGATLRLNNTSTLQASLNFAGTGVIETAALVNVLSAYAHAGLTRVIGGQAVFDNAASVTFAALTHTAGFLDIQRPAATITGPFTRTGGTLRTTGSTVTFAGGGTQVLDLSVASTFANLAVASGTMLVVQAANNATVTGTLTNLGVIRKTRTMAIGSNVFGLTGVTLNVAALGTLGTVQIDRRDVTHPAAGPEQQTGRYWTMTPVGMGFTLSVTLPHAIPDHASTSACRFTGASWDCARTSSAPGSVTRTAVTTLSDWTVGTTTGDDGYAITGTVRDLNDTGVANVTVNLTGTTTATTTTNADGRYAFTGLPDGGTFTVTPSQTSFLFTPQSQTFANLTSDQEAAFFLAEVGTFTRYFAEGATSDFFETEIALLNATGEATTASLTFLKGDGTTVSHDVPLAGLARATVYPKLLPGMASAEFSTVVTSSQPLIADRTMRWDARGYGSHAETSIAAPALQWYLAEGATIGGFNLFYLIQNPNNDAAQVEVTFLLPAPQAPLVRTYTIVPNSRFNIWVNLEDPVLAAAEVSGVIRSTNNVPVIVERAMYRNSPDRAFDAGHESAGITAPATEWFLAEGATGSYFDLFVLIANPQTSTAQVSVDYLLPTGTVLTKAYAVAPQSRFNIWVDFEDAQLASTAVSTRVRSTNDVPIIVERAMWWPGDASTWHEGHNSAGAERTSTKWGLADGQVGGPFDVETYILIANTSSTGGTAQVTLVFEDGTSAVRQIALLPNSRESVPVSVSFPEAAGRRFGIVVESLGTPAPEIVVERAMYGDADGVTWAAGSNVVGTRLR